MSARVKELVRRSDYVNTLSWLPDHEMRQTV
jgi:hypothetical protein